ncbi:MAG: 2-C-methyl-D-erythritol 2,4-cyclodiphosphate synthase [Planctomycetia bacterium TMED53]|nr:MAG: 2-C-methyl-D-erythritol 2,4-cyclodiphosphate synthase [Planctomycetia bacterium TMED53]
MSDFESDQSGRESDLSYRFGLGSDRHRLEEGDGLILSGVKVACDLSAVAHSDGDAVLHAVADAIFGASGGADIGEHFPDDDDQFKGMDSSAIVEAAVHWALEKGWKPAQLDIVIHLERPRLSGYREKMKENLSRLLTIPVECIGLKAKSGEGLGPVGEGRAVDALAIIQLKRAEKR